MIDKNIGELFYLFICIKIIVLKFYLMVILLKDDVGKDVFLKLL